MILLNGHSLERKDWFRVETMSLNLEEKNSTATITVGPEAPEIAINDWLQDDTEPGKGIVWRVRTVTKNVESRTRTIQLEHVIQLLKDRVLFDEIKPDAITGNPSAEKCTAREAADYIMRRQTEWRLGQIEGSRSAPYNFNGDTLFTALETVTNSLPDMQWEYDLRSMPFTLNIVKRPTGFQSEMRMRRNISTMRIQIDKTRMYTRLYPIGKNNLHISGNYVSKNERVWGRVDKVLTDQTRESEEDLLGWAQDNLNRHCEPLVTVTITGLELSTGTGEPLDHIVVGRRCRLPLPKYGIWMTERVTKMSWTDKIKEPDKVTVTLANQLEDVASIINQQNTSTASSSAGGRRAAKKEEEDHAWFVDTTDHVAMVAEAVAGEGASKDWSRVAEVLVDGKGIHQRVTYAEGEIVKQEARIDINEKRILQEVTDRTNADSTLSGRITTEAGRITAEVTRAKGEEELLAGRLTITERTITQEVTDRTNADRTLSGRITTEAGKITQIVEAVGKDGRVTAASIVLAVNDGDSSIKLNADHVDVDGILTTARLKAKIAQIDDLSIGGVVRATHYYIGTGALPVMVDAGVYDLRIEQSGNTYTLQKQTYANGQWADVASFSRATTLRGAWSGGIYEVTASPQGSSINTALIDHLINGGWSSDNKTYTGYVAYGSGESFVSTGRQISVDASTAYNAGYGSAKVTGSWSGGTYTATKRSSGSDSASTSLAGQLLNGSWSSDKKTYTGDVAYAVGESLYSTGRQVTVNASEAYSAGADSVTADDPYAASSTTGTKTSNTIYSKTSTGKTNGRSIYLDYDSSEHVVWVRWDSMSGTRILGRSV